MSNKPSLENSYQEAPESCDEMLAAAQLLHRSRGQAGQTWHYAWQGIYRGRSSSFDQTSYSLLHHQHHKCH